MLDSLINRIEENIAISLRLVLPSIVVILGLPVCMTAPVLVPPTVSPSKKITIALAPAAGTGFLDYLHVEPLKRVKPEAVVIAR